MNKQYTAKWRRNVVLATCVLLIALAVLMSLQITTAHQAADISTSLEAVCQNLKDQVGLLLGQVGDALVQFRYHCIRG